MMYLKARAVIISNGKIFLSKCAKQWGAYLLPWGTLEPGETITECLHREIFEELGKNISVQKLLWVREYQRQSGGYAMEFMYLLHHPEEFLHIDRTKCSHASEWSEAGFFDMETLDTLPVFPKNLKEIVQSYLENDLQVNLL